MTQPFPSIETLMALWLPTQVGVHVTAESWADFTGDPPAGELPLIVLDRVSGADLDPKMDRPIIDIDVYGRTRAEAQDLAEEIRFALRDTLPNLIVDNVVFTRTRTIVAPRSLAHGNPLIRRYSATYELVLHLIPAA